jgi:hypothetical protein
MAIWWKWIAPVLAGAALGQTLGDALAKLQANDSTGAAKMLEQIVQRESANGRAWRNLGLAYDNLKEYDRAIEAHRRALEVQPSMPAPMLSIAADYALKKDAEHAFEWLAKAKATKKIDMTQATVNAAFDSIKSDARFKAAMPARADFDNPFVEPVKILREWDGEGVNDQFGWIARAINATDFVTSAPTRNNGAGAVYVYSAKTGKMLWRVDGEPGARLGIGIESAGGGNVIASAPGAGKAYILSGRDGKKLVEMTAEDKGDAFGRHVASVGDVDHDGVDDVIIGAPNNAKGRGAAYIYSGRDGKLLLKLTGESENDNFGAAVSGHTDKTGTLLLVGAPGAGAGHRGKTYVYKSLDPKPAFTFDAAESGQALGAMFVSVPGDLDGDGFPDVFASDFSDGGKAPGAGRVYLYSGRTGAELFTLSGDAPGEGFGTSESVAGDVDGDGHADLIVGSWQYGAEAIGAGRARLYSGKDGSLIRTYTCKIPGDTFGFDAVGMGDLDGDGDVDFLITSAWSGVNGFHSGRIFLISSGVKRAARQTRAGKR